MSRSRRFRPSSNATSSTRWLFILSRYVATKENKWQGVNFPRWVNKEYDATVDAADGETDPIKRAALYIKANDIQINDFAEIPLVARRNVSGRREVACTANHLSSTSGSSFHLS